MDAKTVKEFEAWRQDFVRDNTKFPSSQDAWNAALAWARTQQEPVAAVVSKYGDPEAFGERELAVLTDLSNAPYGTKLYAAPVAPTVPKGWKLVPEEPTEEQLDALTDTRGSARTKYRALLAAAPEYKEGE